MQLIETVAPADTAGVSEVIRHACRDGVPIYPIGGGMGLDYGGRPVRPGIGLSLEKLNHVIDHPADDMTITVGAGLTWVELSQHLATQRQQLPIEVPQPDRATVGGVLATNPSGPRRYGHGTMRESVIGIRAVDGTGTEFSGGGRVVKNAAGYDLCKLMIGSLGTIGVVTQVTFMVRPESESSAMVTCDVTDLDAAELLLAELVNTQTLPVAVELLAGSEPPPGPVFGQMTESSIARLLVGFEGSQVEVEWMVEQIRKEWGELGVSGTITTHQPGPAGAWGWLSELPADVQINVLPSATVAMVEQLLNLDQNCSIQSHAGNGVIRLKLSPSRLLTAELLRSELRPAVANFGGNMVLLSTPDDEELTAADIWGPSTDAAKVMRAVKDRFDPQGILNPGKIYTV